MFEHPSADLSTSASWNLGGLRRSADPIGAWRFLTIALRMVLSLENVEFQLA
jgi:hypothetical protein